MKETSTSYTWPNGGIIHRIEVRQQKNGEAIAYIYADDREELRPKRHDIRTTLRQRGWGTLSDHRDGQYALRVSGLKDGTELIDLLTRSGFVSGEATTTSSEVEGAKSKNAWEFIKNHSLRISALIYTLGDCFYFKGSNNKFDKGMAFSFGFGDAMLGVFGGRDDARQYKSLLGQLKQHLDVSGIDIPKTASIHTEVLDSNRGFWGQAHTFIQKHINTIKIASEVVGGAFVLRSGLQKDEKGLRNPYNIISGLIIMAGWAGALLVKEKKIDREALANAGPVERISAEIQAKPLMLAGGAGLTFNALKITDSLVNRKPTSKWNIAGVSSMISANGLYAISQKTVGGDIKTNAMVSDIYSVAAQILNKQPDSLRDAAMESTAKFLGERPEIKDTHQQIIVRLKEFMTIQRQSPWFEPLGLPPYTPQPKKGLHREAVQPTAAANDDMPRPMVEAIQREPARAAAATAPLPTPNFS